MLRASILLLAMSTLLAGCESPAPQYGDIVTMRASDAAALAGHPAPGTVWRLDEGDLAKLSPAPSVEAPPPPRLPPPPRPNDPPPAGYYHPAPYYGPHIYWWGPSFHYWRRR
jgi:hypothetical protein